jgi:hypothetical protein
MTVRRAVGVVSFALLAETNDANHPGREVFDHFVAIDVTWR